MINKILFVVLILGIVFLGFLSFQFCIMEENNSGQTGNISFESPNIEDIKIPEGTLSNLEGQIDMTLEGLKGDPESFNLWSDLGMYMKAIENHEKALEIWEYTLLLKPRNTTTLINVANLYAYHIKDALKAEEKYKKAIEIGPNEQHFYFATYNFYKDILKDDKKALEIIKLGIKNNPENKDLRDFLSEIE